VDSNQYVRESARVVTAAGKLAGGAAEAAFWFHNHPIADFNDKTAEVLVSEGRTEDVLRSIEMLSAGSAG
jgi:hypothetical protein